MNLKTAFLSLAAFGLLAADMAVGQLNSCFAQSPCLDITFKQQDLNTCDSVGVAELECEFRVCSKTTFGGDCTGKASTNTISHSCVMPNDECLNDDALFFGGNDEIKLEPVPNGNTQCQIVPRGGNAHFLYFDAGGCGDSNVPFVDPTDDSITCNRLPNSLATQNCGGGGNNPNSPVDNPVNNPCVWTVAVPNECDSTINGGGDPYFKTWSGRYYGYHGECDLIMMQSPSFGAGLGLDLHIRTTIEDSYSLISSAALRIGSDTLEVHGDDIYFNSQKVDEENAPTNIAGFTIQYITEQKGKMRLEVNVGNHNLDEKIVFRRKKGFMWIDFKSPSKTHFQNSTGLLGSYQTGDLLSRDGETVYKNTDNFAEQWQVKDTDDKLFHNLRAPQYPEKCIMPQTAETKKLRRLQKTISREKAAQACAHWPKQGQESCIFDVMMTGDLEMADEPF